MEDNELRVGREVRPVAIAGTKCDLYGIAAVRIGPIDVPAAGDIGVIGDVSAVRRSYRGPLQTSARRNLTLLTPIGFDRPEICFACRIAGVENSVVAGPGKIEVP